MFDPNRVTDWREKRRGGWKRETESDSYGDGADTRAKGDGRQKRERDTLLKSHVNPMGRGTRVHRSINLDIDNRLCKRSQLVDPPFRIFPPYVLRMSNYITLQLRHRGTNSVEQFETRLPPCFAIHLDRFVFENRATLKSRRIDPRRLGQVPSEKFL